MRVASNTQLMGGKSGSKREDKVSPLGTHNVREVENSSADEGAGGHECFHAVQRSGVGSQWTGLRFRLGGEWERV